MLLAKISPVHAAQKVLRACAVLWLTGTGLLVAHAQGELTEANRALSEVVKPLTENYCLSCHSAEKQKGDINFEAYASVEDVVRKPKEWQQALEQLGTGEMPPEGKPQPTPEERERLIAGIARMLEEAAKARAGDPGPVMLRRLNNAEYTYTIRDLTGVTSLDPAREFPADSASGEGFMNVGNSLVMSPSLMSKYLDAAKEIARHAVLLPHGIEFSPSTSARDWTEEKLNAIRSFYARFTETGGGTAVNLQGIKFDTRDGGVLPLEAYLTATLAERDAIRAGKAVEQVARERGLNTKYLGALWASLNDPAPALLLDSVRAEWAAASPAEVPALASRIREWQSILWRFTTVGHIGKRDGPKAWQLPVNPLVETQDLKLEIPGADGEVTLYLTATDAGDGHEGDVAIWSNPRLTAPGRPDVPLRELQAVAGYLEGCRAAMATNTEAALSAVADLQESAPGTNAAAQVAARYHLDPLILQAWLNFLGLGAVEERITSYMTNRLESANNYPFIKGWTGADALSVLANSSGEAVRIPGQFKAHSIAVHPSPQLSAVVGWRSPVPGSVRVEARVQDAHPECGNGVTWSLQVRRGGWKQQLASGTSQGANETKIGPLGELAVQSGEVICLVIGPRDGSHVCDLTVVDLTISEGTNRWDLAGDVSPDILAGNPHRDSFGTPDVWHFYSEPEGAAADSPIPPGSLLAQWQSEPGTQEKKELAGRLQRLLLSDPGNVPGDSPDALLYRRLRATDGPLLSFALNRVLQDPALRASLAEQSSLTQGWGVAPGLFGHRPAGGAISPADLSVQAPAVIPVKLPGNLFAGWQLAATGTLDKEAGSAGSVQLQILTNHPGDLTRLRDKQFHVTPATPIITRNGSVAQNRLVAAFDQFRDLFPAALCYTKLVPVDEVVTLTLFYREDEVLRRLMLDEAQVAELNRLWDDLYCVSQAPLKMVDAFEQLWQYATQDADPSAFEPLREPIRQQADQFRKRLLEAEPVHLNAAVAFAESAYRRPLSPEHQSGMRALYGSLRGKEIAHDEAIRLLLAKVLSSPSFLYRAEQPAPGGQPGPVDDWELATRLSYFLWSSSPDAQLRAAAAAGRLREPAMLAAQVDRMLRDPRVRRLAVEFACSWLQIYDFPSLDEKNERHFPTFAALREPMFEEAVRFFTDLFQQDGSILSVFDADHTFLNSALAAHYGIPGVTGEEWRRVNGVKQFGRGGVLGFGATLAKHSGASRTSPILRGNWVAEVLLGHRLPRPPKDVPTLPEDEAAETLTVRQIVERHTRDPLCVGCHRHIDGYGFALEAYDTIGRWRSVDLGGRPIDTRTSVYDGTVIESAGALREYLLTKKRQAVLTQFNRKLLGYALGRGVLLSDQPLLKEMEQRLAADDYRFSAAVQMIVSSPQFRQIRGRDSAGD